MIEHIFAVTVFLAAPVFAGQVVNVPSGVNKDASFIQTKSTDKQEKISGLQAPSKDGAKAVIGEALLLTALADSQIGSLESNDEQARVVLKTGGFLVNVGSKPVVLDLGGADILVTSATIIVLRDKGDWLVRVETGLQEKKPVLRYPFQSTSSLSAIAPSDSAVAEPTQAAFAIEANKSIRFSAGSEPKSALSEDDVKLAQALSRLKEPPRSPVIKPLNVEDLSDIAIGKSNGGDGDPNVEIEGVEIEIEADCVEVCTD